MTAPGDPTDSDSRWHFMDDFRGLVVRSSQMVMLARTEQDRLSSGSEQEDLDHRWMVARYWAEAAHLESELLERLRESGRRMDAHRTAMYAVQYYLFAGDPGSAAHILNGLTSTFYEGSVPEEWSADIRSLQKEVGAAQGDLLDLFSRVKLFAGSDKERESLLMEIARKFPGSAWCFFELSALYQKRGDVKLALQWIVRAREFDPDDMRFRIQESHLRIDMDEAERAADLLRGELCKDANSPEIRVSLALALVRIWQAHRARSRLLEEADELLRIESPDALSGSQARSVAVLLRCYVLHSMGRLREAEDLRIRLLARCDPPTYHPNLMPKPVDTWALDALLDVVRPALRRAA